MASITSTRPLYHRPSVMGLKPDIHLTGDNYQWLGSMFYIGYLAWEYPTNRLLQRLPLAKWSAFNIIAWGGTLFCCLARELCRGSSDTFLAWGFRSCCYAWLRSLHFAVVHQGRTRHTNRNMVQLQRILRRYSEVWLHMAFQWV